MCDLRVPFCHTILLFFVLVAGSLAPPAAALFLIRLIRLHFLMQRTNLHYSRSAVSLFCPRLRLTLEPRGTWGSSLSFSSAQVLRQKPCAAPTMPTTTSSEVTLVISSMDCSYHSFRRNVGTCKHDLILINFGVNSSMTPCSPLLLLLADTPPSAALLCWSWKRWPHAFPTVWPSPPPAI